MNAANLARWHWVETSVVFAIHDFQIAEHGGSDGVRDRGAVESALMRPVNLALYAEPDAADLAASYACGLYIDCNYGTQAMPWDKWFGSFHDGTAEATRRVREYQRKKRGGARVRTAAQQ